MAEYKRVEYMCTRCGHKITLPINSGRPDPGFCPKNGKTKDGFPRPHSWRINRKY